MGSSTDGAGAWPRLRAALARPGVQLALLLAGATAIRIAHWATVRGNPYLSFRTGDELHYHAWAQAIAAGAWVGETVFPTGPLFPYYLGVVYRVAGESIAVVTALNAVLGVGTVWLTWAAARRLTGRMEVAIGAGALVAFCRAPIFYESSPDKTSLVLFFTALAFFALAVAVDRGSPRAWVAAGLAVGFGALGHALLLAFLPAAAAGLLLLQGAARKTLVCVAAYGLGACLGVAPATVHNAVRGGELELICSNGGIGLYLGNHAGNPTGLYTSPPFSRAEYSSELADFKSEAERRVGRPLGPGQVSAFWTRQALREMADQPLLTLTRFLRKVRWTVGEEEISDTRSFDFYLTQLRVLPRLPWGFGFVAALGLVGGCVSLRGRRVVLVPFVVAYWGALSLFFVYGRYRLPLLIPMAILGAGLTAWLPDVVRERRARAAALAASGAVLAAMLVFTPVLPAVPVSFFADYYNQGNRYLRLGRTDLAIAEYEKALTVRPGIHPAVTGVAITVADLEVRRGERDRAIALLRAVLQHRPGDAALTAKLAEMESAAGR